MKCILNVEYQQNRMKMKFPDEMESKSRLENQFCIAVFLLDVDV